MPFFYFVTPSNSYHSPRKVHFVFFIFPQDFSDLHVDTLRVVANCLGDSETSQMIHESGGLARLMEFVLITEVAEIRDNAVMCIAKAAQSCKHSKNGSVVHFGIQLLRPSLEICVVCLFMFLLA